MLNHNFITILAVSSLLLTAFSIPASADSTGFSATRKAHQINRHAQAGRSKVELYKVRDRIKRHKGRHKRHKHHRHNRHRRGLFLFNAPYDPFFGPAWGYPPGFRYYDRHPRSGITFYFHN